MLLIEDIISADIKNFKEAVSYLNDVANDLESRFFYLSKNEEFIQITKELSLV